MSSEQELIREFLEHPPFAVVGASNDPAKYGHKVFAAYLASGLAAYPVNPRAEEILGRASYPSIASIPDAVSSVSVITPPAVTEQIVDDAHAAGVKRLWLQPGAESTAAIERAESLGMQVIHGGACVLVALSLSS